MGGSKYPTPPTHPLPYDGHDLASQRGAQADEALHAVLSLRQRAHHEAIPAAISAAAQNGMGAVPLAEGAAVGAQMASAPPVAPAAMPAHPRLPALLHLPISPPTTATHCTAPEDVKGDQQTQRQRDAPPHSGLGPAGDGWGGGHVAVKGAISRNVGKDLPVRLAAAAAATAGALRASHRCAFTTRPVSQNTAEAGSSE